MSRRLAWDEDGRTWPNREASRFVGAAGMTWHVQRQGAGPILVLAHGTGAATHSWRGLAPLLARDFDVVAFDLPGHGFTDPLPGAATLPAMARAVAGLLDALEARPALAVGHSAGAAVLARMRLDGLVAPRGIVGINAALMPFRGIAAHLFAPLAKLLTLNPFVPRVFSATADRRSAERLIRNTGSAIDPAGVDLYARALASPAHVAGALAMMANWDLDGLAADLPDLGTPLLLVVGGSDRAVSPDDAERVRGLVPGARVADLRGLGHLAHEERPDQVAALVRDFANQVGASGL
jgi:magnesium chelatase accessory protein